MAGHSKFKNIMHRKGAQDRKRAKVFERLGREISTAVRLGGSDDAFNPRLRMALTAARKENMPKDNVDRAIKRGAGSEADDLAELRYEGYGPGGTAFIVECLSDNRNRTAASVRASFSKHNGSLVENGAVTFLFAQLGEIRISAEETTEETVFNSAVEVGGQEMEQDESHFLVYTAMEDLASAAIALEKTLRVESARLVWKPHSHVVVPEGDARTLVKLLTVLEDNPDVLDVYSNFELEEAILERLLEA